MGQNAHGQGLRSADVQSIYKNSPDTNMVTLGKAAMDFAHSNQLVGYQALNKDKVSGMALVVFGREKLPSLANT